MAKLWMTLFEDGTTAITTNQSKMNDLVSKEHDRGNPPLAQKQFRSGVAKAEGSEIYDALDDPKFPYD